MIVVSMAADLVFSFWPSVLGLFTTKQDKPARQCFLFSKGLGKV